MNHAPERAVASPKAGTTTPGASRKVRPPYSKSVKRRRPRRKAERTKDQEWEQARQDAWLREMLTDSSESENEEKCGRFAKSGRWITELFRIPQHSATTSRGECSGQKTPELS